MIPSVVEDGKQRVFLQTAGRNIKWHNHSGKEFGIVLYI